MPIANFKSADVISQPRLWDLLMDVAKHGATQKGGVNRQALSAEDIAARNHVVAWAKARGFDVAQDDVGNLYVRYEGKDPSLPPVMTGSHLDSQPTGGKFDGAYGVLAGLEVIDGLKKAGVQPDRSIEVVAWMNEEGSRYSPGAMGSAVFAGVRKLDSLLDIKDSDGVVLRDALSTTLKASPITLRKLGQEKVRAYVELHIEQGPILESQNKEVGVVTGIQGIKRIDIDITGEEAHAGTTPRRIRKDALVSAVAIIAALEKLTEDKDDVLRFTVGRCQVFPGSPNTVPGRVHFTIDMRHPDDKLLHEMGEKIAATAQANAKGCQVEVKQISHTPPTIFPKEMVDLVRESTDAVGFSHIDLPSGAGHDAMHMAKICPTGMIFIPCLRGVSHNESESASPEQVTVGAQVLAETLLRLAQK